MSLERSFKIQSLAVEFFEHLTGHTFNDELPTIILKRYSKELGINFKNTQELKSYFDHFTKPHSENYNCKLLDYLRDNLTPRHFLTDKKFTAHKDIFFKPNPCPESDSEKEINSDFYQNPDNLTDAGKLRVNIELKRLENVYRKAYEYVHGTNEKKLDHDVFLALYLYTTNLGYTKINSKLRFGHHKGCEKVNFGEHHNCETIVELINRGIARLSKLPNHQLKPDEHLLVRFLKLPLDLLRKIVSGVEAANVYLDKAFLSTSFNSHGAEAFKEDSNLEIRIKSNGSTVGCKLDVEVEGIKYNLSPFPDEGEYLLPPGTKLHITIPEGCNPTDPDYPIQFDEITQKATLIAALTNFATVVYETLATLKASIRFLRPIRRPNPSVSSVISDAIDINTSNTNASALQAQPAAPISEAEQDKLVPIELSRRPANVAQPHLARSAAEPTAVTTAKMEQARQLIMAANQQKLNTPTIILGEGKLGLAKRERKPYPQLATTQAPYRWYGHSRRVHPSTKQATTESTCLFPPVAPELKVVGRQLKL